MKIHPLAGKPVPEELLIDVGKLKKTYYERKPDVGDPEQLVSFGTSGHRGTPLEGTFNEEHILAISQAICDYRRSKNINGPLFIVTNTPYSTPEPSCKRKVLSEHHRLETFIQKA